MRHRFLFFILFTSCQLRTTERWEGIKTSTNYVTDKVALLFGAKNSVEESEVDFNQRAESLVLLDEKDLKEYYEDSSRDISQTNQQFKTPPSDLRHIFKKLHFKENSHMIHEHNDLQTIRNIADHIKKNPNLSLLIEGHSDLDGSGAYNMTLGTKRSQYVKDLLLKEYGVDPSQIHAVSYGKERPEVLKKDSYKNRRVEFKLLNNDID